MSEDRKFPTEIIDLPSKGKAYPKESPLSGGKLELKYMTAKEEDILTSQNLIKKGLVIDTLLNSLIMTKDVRSQDLILGDKNAVMVAARILAYGPEYECEVTNPQTGENIKHTFNLADCPFKEIDKNFSGNVFSITLPVSKKNIKFRLLTGKEEKNIEKELEALKKINPNVSKELTTRLKYTIVEVDGNTERIDISSFVDNMLSRDSLFLRSEMVRVSPDINMTQEIDIEGDLVEVEIPMTSNFFWPAAG